jgi:tellurite resistance protein
MGFKKMFGLSPEDEKHVAQVEQAVQMPAATEALHQGDTATVRRIVGKLEALPPERARLIASGAYTLARAANADLEISDDETKLMETLLHERKILDEATAIIVVEMAKLQARTIGGSEDYSVTREFSRLATREQRREILRACYLIGAVNGSISAEENATVNELAKELELDAAEINEVRAEFHDRLSVVQALQRLREAQASRE